jgi:hypothetical protein
VLAVYSKALTGAPNGQQKTKGFRPRGSSAIWVKDGLNKAEKLAYRKAMGWER